MFCLSCLGQVDQNCFWMPASLSIDRQAEAIIQGLKGSDRPVTCYAAYRVHVALIKYTNPRLSDYKVLTK